MVFDLDGTLIQSAEDLANSVNHALSRVGLAERTLAEVEGFVGDGVRKLIARSLGSEAHELFPETLEIFMEHYWEHCTDNTVLYPGVAETLAGLEGIFRLAVLTNKSERFTIKILRHLGVMDYFGPLVAGDTLTEKKPDPAGILFLAQQWNLSAAELLMVGDHATDIQTGINAGAPTVFIEGGIGERRGLTPDAVIKSIDELPALLKTIL